MAKELECDFYFGKNLPGGEQLRKMDVKSLPGFKKESRVFKIRYIWQCNVIQQAFKKYQIYILTGSPSLSNIVFMIFAKILNKKVYLWTHGLKTLEEGRRSLARFFFRSATGYFLYGNYGKEIMTKFGIPENYIFVINNSMDYDRQLEVRNQLVSNTIYVERFKNSDPVIIYSGRLLKNKKVEMILEGQKILISECPFNFVLVGDGSERVKLEDKARELGVMSRVWFYGACYEEQKLGNLFYNATLTISPGNVGLTAIHSMMYGTPVLTHDNFSHQMPEFEAVRQGETGLFFKENDLLDLAGKIKCWIERRKDRNETRRKCFDIIDNHYNPYHQIKVIKQAIENI
jgi:glycosyltransferase involved in cell wall biosynthesis